MNSHLKQIRSELSLTQRELADILGCSKNNICMIETGKSALTQKNKMMLVKFLNINPRFIETGTGPILSTTARREAAPAAKNRGINTSIPLYNINKAGGLKHILEPSGEIEPDGFIGIPNLPKCDGAAYHVGDAMYPILRSGDIVLYRTLADVSEIFWGEMYLVSVTSASGDYVSVCYLDKSPITGYAVMRGATTERSETEIKIDRINAIAFVVATIRLNTAK